MIDADGGNSVSVIVANDEEEGKGRKGRGGR